MYKCALHWFTFATIKRIKYLPTKKPTMAHRGSLEPIPNHAVCQNESWVGRCHCWSVFFVTLRMLLYPPIRPRWVEKHCPQVEKQTGTCDCFYFLHIINGESYSCPVRLHTVLCSGQMAQLLTICVESRKMSNQRRFFFSSSLFKAAKKWLVELGFRMQIPHWVKVVCDPPLNLNLHPLTYFICLSIFFSNMWTDFTETKECDSTPTSD